MPRGRRPGSGRGGGPNPVDVHVGQRVRQIDEADGLAVGQPRQVPVHLLNAGPGAGIVVARKHARHDHNSLGSVRTTELDNRLDAAREIGNAGVVERVAVDVVRTRLHDEHLRRNSVELAVREPPEHVLRAIAAPREVRRMPAVEAFTPVREELRIIGRAPPPRSCAGAPRHRFYATSALRARSVPSGDRDGRRGRRLHQDRLI